MTNNTTVSERDVFFQGIYTQGRSLRHPLGGRLRVYRPKGSNSNRFRRLDAIKKALVRGELTLNGFNRWRFQEASRAVIGWTFVEGGTTARVADIEAKLAMRESENLDHNHILHANEQTANEKLSLLIKSGDRPGLILVQCDWIEHPKPHSNVGRLIEFAISRRLIIHVIAAVNFQPKIEDDLYQQAQQRLRYETNPLLRPSPQVSNIERKFGNELVRAGLVPEPQKAVANYFLDFAIVGEDNGLPVRFDIEVDGKYWHEEIKGVRRPSDDRRDQVLKKFGWRPIRFWTEDIAKDTKEYVRRILDATNSQTETAMISEIKE